MHDPADYARIETAPSPVFSVDGTRLFHLRGAGLQQLWVLDLASRQSRPLTGHDEKVSALRRAPADDRVVYSIDAGGDERHQLWLLEDGATRALTTDGGVVHGLGAWSADGARISLTANDREPAHYDVLSLDVASGVRTRLFEGTHEATAGGWAADGRLVAVMDRATGDQRPVVIGPDGALPLPRSGPAQYASLRWDGGALLGLSTASGLGLSTAGGLGFVALCRIDLSGEATPVYAPEGRDVEAWALSAAGLLATIENDRGYTVLRVGPRDGERPVVPMPPGVAADLSWSVDGARLAFAFSAPTRPGGLWMWEAGVAAPVWEAGSVPPFEDFELVGWTGFDGLAIPGWFAVPRGAAPAGGWPAVVWVHGGPAAQTRGAFRADMQALLHQGYAVLMPNVRGSTGYGTAYMDADDVARRLESVHDLAAGRHWLAARPGIDAERIAVMGQSYGGYMVLAAVTEYPALWRCAIDFYGIADFATLLAATSPWRRAHRSAEYGDPMRHRALFDRISPIRHFGRVRVPLLVLHGTRDPRVGIGESEQVVAALQADGRPVTYEVFDYAGHGFVRPDDKDRVYRAVAAFLQASFLQASFVRAEQ